MNITETAACTSVQLSPRRISFEESLADFLAAENARIGDGPSLLPALEPLDWGRMPAGAAATTTESELPCEPDRSTPAAPRVWPLVTGALLLGTGVGLSLGLLLAARGPLPL
ncbi:MAG: hypothetical protein HY290_04095 [Planctomycetia bacterium]|nr:hypothetical protein [Planctomycetia bacterium]